MKVAVIAAEMEGDATGVGRYLEGLLHGLALWNHGVEWHLFFQGDPSQQVTTRTIRITAGAVFCGNRFSSRGVLRRSNPTLSSVLPTPYPSASVRRLW